ncbi:hypothetical protein KF840_07165 [bacterium]|nr:hypothetical protein [bacterium]
MNESELVNAIREEARDVKQCFTSFTFQGILFASAVFGFIIKFQPKQPLVGIASVLVVFILLTIGRIGTYKYGTANRNAGYELHLYRTFRLAPGSGRGWRTTMREIGWEEAMRAWRVVQGTVFEELYDTGSLRPNRLRREYRELPKEERWFEPRALAESGGATYYPGSYLRTMLSIIYIMIAAAFVPFYWMTVQYHQRGDNAAALASLLMNVGISILALVRCLHLNVRLGALEQGLLSIHSCSIVWQAVIVAHFRALDELKSRGDDRLVSYRGYTAALGRQATDLKRHVLRIHQWIEGPIAATTAQNATFS